MDIIKIFQNCPFILKGNHNISTHFSNSLERIPMIKTVKEYGRIDVLLQHVNNRIIEKYKGFTEAFRRFDKNFDGSLNFREFVIGMGEMGISLSLPDYRLIFDKIDFDKED
jgi:Ca2+-binding EF-hand superfamily protein